MIMNCYLDTTSRKRNRKPITKVVKNTWEEKWAFLMYGGNYIHYRKTSVIIQQHTLYTQEFTIFLCRRKTGIEYRNVKLEWPICRTIAQSI